MSKKKSKKDVICFYTLIVILISLSTVDAFATAFGIDQKVYTESNPLMQLALISGLGGFILIKSGIVLLGCSILIAGKEYKVADYAASIGVLVYTAVVVLHSYMLSTIYI